MVRIAMIAVLALCAFAAPQDQPPAVDVVFVVDASNSMSKNDPEGMRNHFMAMTADFMQGRGGDRLAIVQFAGWNESQNKKVVVFPLTEIPQPGKGADFEKAFDAAVAKAEIFGSASDINVAFELGVAEIQKQRGATKNGLWVIVLTDAALSAPEPSSVREEYKKKAAELFQLAPDDEANLDQLNAAALDIFKNQVVPKFAGVKISAVTLAKKAPSADSPIQLLVGKEGKVGVLTKDPLKDLIVPMLAGSQLYPKQKGGFYGYAKESGTAAQVPVHVYEGGQGTRAVIFSRGATVTVKVNGPDAAKAEAVGDGPYKVVHFRNVAAGDYTIDVDAAGGTQIESIVYSDLPYAAEIKMTTPAEIAAGDEVRIDIGVTRDGKALTDVGLLRSLKAKVKIKTAQGETTRDVTFKGDSKATFTYATDAAAPAGVIEFTVDLAGVQDGTVAANAFTVTPQVFKVTTATVVEASFDKAEILVDEAAGFAVKGAKGTPPKELLTEIPIKKSGTEQRYKLTWKDGGWTGTVPTDSIGEYEIVAEKKGGYQLKPGKTPKLTIKGRLFEAKLSAAEVFIRQPVMVTVKVADGGRAEAAKDLVKEIKLGSQTIKLDFKGGEWTGSVDTSAPGTFELADTTAQKFLIKGAGRLLVKDRNFTIVDKEGKPVTELTFPVRYIEKDQKHEIELTMKLDVGEGETGTIESTGDSKVADVVIRLGDGKPVSVTAAATTVKGMATLTINTNGVIAEQIGSLVVTGKVAGIDFTKTIPVKVTFTDKLMKLFMKYLPFIIGGLVLLLILLYLMLLGKWKEQQLRAFLNNNLDTKYLMKSMGGGRSAKGTEQSPGAAGFKLSGMKFTANAVTFSGLKPDVHVFHMDKPLSGGTKLRHGDVLSVEVGTKKQHYVYFEKEPTPEELKKALDGLIESDEIFIEE